ncbi:MAG: hypothetical protein QMB34_06445 [Paracoccaceae bacterium]|jgi:hypothetical protein|nr:hypothetical protein [Paracoccaceae bacterium]|tara:strand:+ start:185 stop:784 length:600 start_codon:yes stop_codon:yes gene_type:complete
MAEINPSVGAAYGGGQQIEPRIQALEGLRALEQAERAAVSEASIQERVARRTESVIVTISAEAQAMISADTQRISEPANQPQPIAAPLPQETYDSGVTRASPATQAPVVAPEPVEAEMNAAPAPEAPETQVAQQDTQPAAGQTGTPETVAPPAPPPADTATQSVEEAEAKAEVVAASAPVEPQAKPEPGDGDASETEVV